MPQTQARAEKEIESISLIVPLPASPARVFAALTQPRDMEVWVWGGIGRDPRAEVDLRVGGRYSVSVEVGEKPDWPRSRWAMQGLFVEISPPTRLAYTVHWDAPVGYNQPGPAVDEVVFVDLVDTDGGTELRYRHFGVPTRSAAAAHRSAILHTFEILKKHLANE
ncbi:MAG: SRPBCC family protein [Tepidisphaeraceae bacterium]